MNIYTLIMQYYLLDENEERLIYARDGLEQFVMSQIAKFSFQQFKNISEDDKIFRRMKVLSFLTLEVQN
jgi:hypothetical protein